MVGSEGHPIYPPTVGDIMAITLGGSDKETISKIFESLADPAGWPEKPSWVNRLKRLLLRRHLRDEAMRSPRALSFWVCRGPSEHSA